ncbi:MAG: transcription antitermination factor NusB [Citromicrobium sp.]|nr:MAG: transcription antitermination factor NusB [Citromicrobium sp.]
MPKGFPHTPVRSNCACNESIRHDLARPGPADVALFDDIVRGVDARRDEIDALIAGRLAAGWTVARMDKTMLQILRAGSYELLARADVPLGAVISEYVDVAKAFFDDREAKFANGVLDAVGKQVRPG